MKEDYEIAEMLQDAYEEVFHVAATDEYMGDKGRVREDHCYVMHPQDYMDIALYLFKKYGDGGPLREFPRLRSESEELFGIPIRKLIVGSTKGKIKLMKRDHALALMEEMKPIPLNPPTEAEFIRGLFDRLKREHDERKGREDGGGEE